MSDASDKPTILIVDDTPANIALLSDVLKGAYRIKVALDGQKALEIANSAAPPQLILLDIMMPGMDGYEVCKRLKADPVTHPIPIIFISAMSEVEDETRGLDLGGVDYVTKPINAAIVKARVKAQLALADQARRLQQMVGKLEAQARELSELNHTLEERIEQGVHELEKLGRLKRFFSAPVVEMILTGEAEDPLKTHRREIAAVFIDLRGFTTFTETSDPEDVMRVVGEYHESMGRVVMSHGGTLEHFAGDGMMIFFNDPLEIDNPAAAAIRMAVEMRERFGVVARGWAERGSELAIGIGVAQGFATIGAIGFEGRRDYGVIGTVTNLAARLCAEAEPNQILMTQRVRGFVNDFIASELVGPLALKGFHRPVVAYAVQQIADQLAKAG